MEITLSNEEKEFLIELLQERRDRFVHEISRTGSHDFKDLLRRKENVLEALLEKVRGIAAPAQHVA